MLSRPVTQPASDLPSLPATDLQPEQIPHLAPCSTSLDDVLTRAAEDLERLFRLWQASTYLWPTHSQGVENVTPASAEPLSVQRSSHSDRLREHRKSIAQIENFSRTADRQATTMRQANRLDLAALYEERAAQAHQRAVLLTSLLTTIEVAYTAIESYRSQVADGGDPHPRMLQHVDGTARRAESVADVRLTPREQQVAALIALGYSNRQIANELVLSRGTVANHIAHILAKLDCRNRTEVAVSIYGSRKTACTSPARQPPTARAVLV